MRISTQQLLRTPFSDIVLDWSRVLMQVGVSLASMKTIGIFQ
mgnify:CR=1 FL=1